MASILIIYGTTSGNTQLVAEKVCEVLSAAGHKSDTKRVEQTDPAEMEKYDFIIWGASTYGHGVLQDYFIPFLDKLNAAKYDLKGKRGAVIGLGDPKYDAQYHIESAAILEEAFKKHGGNLIAPALRISGSPVRHLNGIIQKWAEALTEKIK